MRQVLFGALLLCVLVNMGAATTAEQYVNSTEPGFLQDIGPEDPRVDNPVAALVVAAGVLLVVYNGLRRAGKAPDFSRLYSR